MGQLGSFTVTTTGSPTPTVSESGALPGGVTFTNNGNGTATLSGTPTAAGTHPLTLTAANGVLPNATQSFTLRVNQATQAPAITSAAATTFTTGQLGSFTVTTTGSPTPTVSESGALPGGVTFTNNGNGTATLSGTPTAAGTHPLTLTAANGVLPNATQSFTLTDAPVVATGTTDAPVVATGTTDAPVVATGTTAPVATGTTYYVSPSTTSGSGTLSNPFGLSQLLNTTTHPFTPGPALSILKPGDTLYFLAGTYNIAGDTTSSYWGDQLLAPAVSGTPTAPITLSAYPGATVNIVLTGDTAQPVFGTSSPTLNYVRFIGFTVNPGSDGTTAFYISGVGNEVGYCTINGQYMATSDNHDGIRLEGANSAWIHNNDINGVTGETGNSCGIKLYGTSDSVVEDNYVYDCTSGIFDKDSGEQNTYARNYLTDDPGGAFLGNNQHSLATLYIYDNVVDGGISLQFLNTDCQVYNNLVFASDSYNGYISGIGASTGSTDASIWNNIVLTGGQPVWGYVNSNQYLTDSPLSYMGYNVYDAAPTYGFGLYLSNPTQYTLSQFQAQGFEQHAQVVSSDLSIFQNLTSYALLPQWTTAGRYGDAVGPRYPIAQILNTSRYGPGALSTGSSPSITQQPQNQTVSAGGSATFSVQVNGSGLLYQWQSSSDGGNTWVTIQGASSAAYTIPQVATTENGAVFRCLVSSVGGSAWSNPATLTVN